jgi:hypothetical protein
MISKIQTAKNYIAKNIKPLSVTSETISKSMIMKFDKSDLDKLNNLVKNIPCMFRMEIGLHEITLLLYNN